MNKLRNTPQDPYKRSRVNQKVENSHKIALLTGNSHPRLGKSVAARLGCSTIEGSVRKFADGEIGVSFEAADVQGKHCFILQPTCRPVNDALIELVFMVSACKRAGAERVSVVAPYYGYARQDRRFGNKATPVSASDVTRIIEQMGADQIISVDLHSL